MASIFKRTRSYPVPDGAEISERRRKATPEELRENPGCKTIIERFAKWTDRKTGRTRKAPVVATPDGDRVAVESGNYLIAYFGADGKRRQQNSGTPDLATAERIAGQLENQAALRKAGIIDPTQERFSNEARRPLTEHIDDYRGFLTSKGGTSKHVESTVRYVEIVCQRCNAKQVTDLNGAAVLQVIGELRTKGISSQTKDGAGPRTANAYLTAIKGFSRWLWRERRTPVDALATLARFNEETDRRHVRRELTADEAAYLVSFVEGRTVVNQALPGPARAMVYRLALGTGFRANELRTLTPASFDLDADPPTVTVDAAYSKRRRQDVQPIRQDLADLLRPWLAGHERDARPFGAMPENAARMIRADLDAARAAWIKAAPEGPERESRERSDFLRYENAAGEVADFHSTRHTYISGIVAGGASVKTAQELARHSTPSLTIGRYSHARLHDLTAALDALPDLQPTAADPEPQVMAATGTDDAAPHRNMAAYRQQYGSKTMQDAARSGERPEDCSRGDRPSNHVPQVLCMANFSDKQQDVAERGEKRRARDSNPQPASRHLISSQAANQFAYPPAGYE